MSKIFTTESLSLLRDEFKNYEALDDFLAKYKNETFDFRLVDLEDDSSYPVLNEEAVDQFYRSYKNNPKDEFSLAKILYEALPINSNQASNNLYWLYLNLDSFFSYIKERWIQKLDDDETEDDQGLKNDIERFFLSLEPSQNSLMKSPIAGLWWAIQLTVDETLADKYYYSKIFLSERNLRDKNIGSYQLIRDRKVLQAALDFYHKYKDAELDGRRIGSEAIAQQMIKTLNQIGGLTVLSYLEKDEVFEKLEAYKDTVFQRARKVQLGKKVSRKRIEEIKKKQEGFFAGEESIPKDPQKEPKNRIKGRAENKKQTKEKALKYFNLRTNGEYNLTGNAVKGFDYQMGIGKSCKNGYLLICYNESGYINRIKVSELFKKKRKLYQNGIYGGNTINRILLTEEKAIIGIIYHSNGSKYFKAFLTDQLKSNNGNVGLQGYKTMSDEYDTLEYLMLPIELETKLTRLIFKSFNATGKSFDNSTYKKEFAIINDYSDNVEYNLF
ncbi:DUF6339 family protein [Winogradskyella helgolandensis]|uniref:DUF6339 family protein n=1 Tax=Winogradskyella helgolandensis TaxID=2697010 RepID=UPI0015CC92A9|nr:DUF6339 family protein [Winogradskyella helgolandensis]